MPLFKRDRAKARDGVTLFFATDLHGSEVCFRKFVNAARFYNADVLVLGGDIGSYQRGSRLPAGAGRDFGLRP